MCAKIYKKKLEKHIGPKITKIIILKQNSGKNSPQIREKVALKKKKQNSEKLAHKFFKKSVKFGPKIEKVAKLPRTK